MNTFVARLTAAVSLLAVSLVAVPASAATGNIAGTVAVLKPQDLNYGNTFFQLNSSTRVGTCAFDTAAQKTLILIPDSDRGKQMFALVQGALLAGKSVTAYLDDTVNTGGYCFARSITLTP